MVLSAGASAAPHATKAPLAKAAKYYVCKYVDKPGAAETLQTGQNPIVVSGNAIKENPVVVGSFFNDKHRRSYVLAVFPQDPEPTRDDCPQSIEPRLARDHHRSPDPRVARETRSRTRQTA